MKRVLKITGLIIMILTISGGILIWLKWEKHQKAQALADNIIQNISSEKVYESFPEKYFPKEETRLIFSDLNRECNWEKRDGKFVDFVTQKHLGGINQTSFIYEYYLDCDSLRFVLTMNMENDPEIMGFKMEPIEKENPLILFPEKQLKNRKINK